MELLSLSNGLNWGERESNVAYLSTRSMLFTDTGNNGFSENDALCFDIFLWFLIQEDTGNRQVG